MSNHSGSYMLNDVLKAADEYGLFGFLGKEKTAAFVFKVIQIGYRHDCNPGEILEDMGSRVGICYCCRQQKEGIDEGGLCADCISELG